MIYNLVCTCDYQEDFTNPRDAKIAAMKHIVRRDEIHDVSVTNESKDEETLRISNRPPKED